MITFWEIKRLSLTCSKQMIRSKSVILLILWDALIHVNIYSIRCVGTTVYINSHIEHHQSQRILFGIGYCLTYISFPFFGLLADAKTGRYKTIITSIYFMFFSSWTQ